MFKKNLLLASVALMCAGVAQADEPRGQEREARATLAKNEAAKSSAERAADKEQAAAEALHPDARPVYLNGGHFEGAD